MTVDDDARPRRSGVDPEAAKHAVSHFATGLTVVTGATPGGPAGFTCQAFTSLSLDPPRVLVAPSRSSTTWPRIHATGRFCVNVLADDQEELGRTFARPGADRFAGVAWRPSPLRSPILDGVLAWLDCAVDAVHDGGDHLIVVGGVHGVGTAPHARPLLYHRGGYARTDARSA